MIITLWVLIYKVHPTNHIYVRIYKQCIRRIMKTNIRLYSVLNWIFDASVCRRFVLSMFWSIDVWVCRRFGLSTICGVNVLVCRRFGLSTFRFVDVLVVDVSVCRRFDQLPTKRVHFNISKPGPSVTKAKRPLTKSFQQNSWLWLSDVLAPANHSQAFC